jgi:hypothetical protein
MVWSLHHTDISTCYVGQSMYKWREDTHAEVVKLKCYIISNIYMHVAAYETLFNDI